MVNTPVFGQTRGVTKYMNGGNQMSLDVVWTACVSIKKQALSGGGGLEQL